MMSMLDRSGSFKESACIWAKKATFGSQDLLSNPENIPWSTAVSSVYVQKRNLYYYSHASVNVQVVQTAFNLFSHETDNTSMLIKDFNLH